MRQVATVERVFGDYAEIAVPRKSACGHDCEECAGCGVSGAAVHARARNPVGAQAGQKVVVESETKKMLGIVALVYLIPVLAFLVFYVAAALLTERVGVQYGAAVAGFLLGVVPAVVYDRRLRAQGGLTFTIVQTL